MEKIYVVGLGPGAMADMSLRARDALEESAVVLGYTRYIGMVREYFPGKDYRSLPMTKEALRCEMALEEAQGGKTVALVSGGDSGVYGMAGLMLEVAHRAGAEVDIEIVPGITAATAGAAVLGAPLMHDYVAVSLSDRLTPWPVIEKRLHCGGAGDFVICLYNPRSAGRPDYLAEAGRILLGYRSPGTPVGIVRNISRAGEERWITTLGELQDYERYIDMSATIFIGNSQTYIQEDRMITPRGYRL